MDRNNILQFILLWNLVDGTVLDLDSNNFDSALAKNDIVFVNFNAKWCRFSQILHPIFEDASNKLKNIQGKVIFGSVDCDKQPTIAQRYKISKYPTLKLFRYGQLIRKEYRGQRSVDALSEYVKKEMESPVKKLNEHDDIDKTIEKSKKAVIGYFTNPSGLEYDNFQRISTVYRDECEFWIGLGDWAKSKNIAGNSVFFKAADSYSLTEYNAPIAHFQHLVNWSSENCVPLIREITFENAEGLTEEGNPFLILFRTIGDTKSEESFKKAVTNELLDLKNSITILMADGKKFAHPLYHINKKDSDLPVIAIDSFKHMFPFEHFSGIFTPGKLRKFVEDLHTGKLHREFHHGPDKVTQSPPAESVFNKLKPSGSRYSLLKDEL